MFLKNGFIWEIFVVMPKILYYYDRKMHTLLSRKIKCLIKGKVQSISWSFVKSTYKRRERAMITYFGITLKCKTTKSHISPK